MQYYYFLKKFIVTQRERERGRDTSRGRSRLHAGSPMWDSIPGVRDHSLSQRQMLNHGAIQVSWILWFLFRDWDIKHKEFGKKIINWLACEEKDGEKS